MAFLSFSVYDTPGLAPRMKILLWGPGDFPVSYPNRDTSWNAWNRHSESFMVDRGSYLAIWSLPLTNAKWHSDSWPVIVTSQPIRLSTNFMTLIPSLTFHELRVVSMEHFQRACQQGTLTFPDIWFPPPFGDLLMLQLLRKRRRSDPVLWQNPLYQQKKIRKPKSNTQTPPNTSITQRLRTDLGRSVWVTRPDFANLPCLYSTFHFDYPSVLSRFCSLSSKFSCFAIIFFFIFSTAHTHSCMLWLWYFLKSVGPHWPFIMDAETLTSLWHLVLVHVSYLVSMGPWTSTVVL